jgi:cytochrome b pre-mRNA-processing protein 3
MYIHIFRYWCGPGRIGRDFRSRHAVLTFHVWLLHHRLLTDAKRAQEAQQQQQNDSPASTTTSDTYRGRSSYLSKDIDTELFNVFWDDTTYRIRALNVYELAVNKHLTAAQRYTFVHMVSYDQCYKNYHSDPVERMRRLRHLVYTQWLFPQSTDDTKNPPKDAKYMDKKNPVENLYRATADHIDRLVWYIDTQYQNIMYDCPTEQFELGHIEWIPLPQFANLHHDDHATDDDDCTTTAKKYTNDFIYREYDDTPVPLHPDDVIPQPWISNMTNQGKVYYWNPITRSSTWDRPTN